MDYDLSTHVTVLFFWGVLGSGLWRGLKDFSSPTRD